MRPTMISGYDTQSRACNCAGATRPVGSSSTSLWGGIALVNALLLAGAVYGVWRLVQWSDKEG